MSIEILAPRQPQWERGARQEDLPWICGTIKVMANLQPEQFGEIDGDEWLGPPVQARLFVDDDVFDRLEKHLADADRRDLVIHGHLTLSGVSLPPDSTGIGLIRPRDLILAENQVYSVVEFDLGAHRIRRFMPIRPLSPSTVGRYPSPRSYLTVRLVDFRISLDMERRNIAQIRCDGVIWEPKKAYNGAEVAVEFHERARDYCGDYPTEAAAGTLSLDPPKVNAATNLGYNASIDIQFTEDDLRDFLFPLLTLGSGPLDLTLSLSVDYACLDNATEPISVDISKYFVDVVRDFTSSR